MNVESVDSTSVPGCRTF